MIVLTALLCLVYVPCVAYAHEVRPIIGTLRTVNEHLELVLQLNLEAAMAGIESGYDDTNNSVAAPVYDSLRKEPPDALKAKFQAFYPSMKEGVEIAADGVSLELNVTNISIPDTGDTSLPRTTKLTLRSRVAAKPSQITWRFAREYGNSVMRFMDDRGKVIRAVSLAAGESGGPLALTESGPQDMAGVFFSYVKLGFLHIVPRGIDHILFVLGLFLLSTRLSALTWQISAFTIAHTVTLALGASNIIVVPPSIVEPLIAASIVYVGIENVLTDKLQRWRPAVVFGFGLLHGLGFAGVLGEIGLPQGFFVTSLLGFNIGVEAGQFAVVAAAFILAGWAANRFWYRRLVAIPSSLLISAIAAFWVLERVGVA
jgi:hypothetical protein